MTPAALAAMKSLAEGATPGPYRWQTTGFASQAGEPAPSLLGDRGHGVLSCDGPANGPSEADARYIAAVSPEVVLALVAEVERLRAMVGDAVSAGLDLELAYETAQRQRHNYEDWDGEQWDPIQEARNRLCAFNEKTGGEP